MICTCDNCHTTFDSDGLPSSCQICGKEAIIWRAATKEFYLPAVRHATKLEMERFATAIQQMQREAEDHILKEESLSGLIHSIDLLGKYDLSDDEYNLCLILLHELNTSRYLVPILDYFLHEPDRALSCYKDVKRLFTGKINQERITLKATGRKEPWSVAVITDGKTVLRKDLDDYGATLSVLYRFRTSDGLSTPNLGNIRKIDLEKISRSPGDEYIRFLEDWRKECLNTPFPDFFSDLLF